MKARRLESGMTLVEMLTAIAVLLLMIAILAQVFSQATTAANRGKAMAEVYQVSRALESLVARDLSGATTDFFYGGENGFDKSLVHVWDSPPGPYENSIHGTLSTPAEIAWMERMLMGGSDFIVFRSAGATLSDDANEEATVFYFLRATGELIRVTDTRGSDKDADYYGAAHSDDATGSVYKLSDWEEEHVVAENVRRLKFSFLDRGGCGEGPPADGYAYASGVWRDRWDCDERGYLPAAVKIEVQLVDHLWNLADEDRINGRNYDHTSDDAQDDALRPDELFDPDDGESFTYVVRLPVGMQGLVQ